MGSTSLSPPPIPLRHHRTFPLRPPFPSLSVQLPSPPRSLLLRAAPGGGEGPFDPAAPLRRPAVASVVDTYDVVDDTADEGRHARGDGRRRRRDAEWVDWEDQILEDTVPLVGFVRMILHSGKYESGDRLSPEHEKTIVERLLMHHPQYEKKIGCGIDYITIGYHPDYENSRCLFISRKDGELVDFSFWKCIKVLSGRNIPCMLIVSFSGIFGGVEILTRLLITPYFV